MDIKKNEIIEITIDGISSEGNGIGRLNNIVVFVPASGIGDKLKVKILKVKKSYAFGKIEEILVPADSRTKPDCDQYLKCGGCVYRHIDYETEKLIKEEKVKSCLARIGGFKDIKVNNIVGSKYKDKYRNKAQIPIGKNKNGSYELGFFATHSHRIVDCMACNLQPNVFNEIIAAFKMWLEKARPTVYNENTEEGTLRHLYIRQAENKVRKEIMVCVVINDDKLPCEDLLVQILTEKITDIKSIIININKDKTNVIMGKKCRTIWGEDHIKDTLCGLDFRISAHSFYQVNKTQAENLYKIVAKYADCKSDDILLDLYCGTGTIGLTMAKSCKKLIGVEIVKEAIEDAKYNAKLNGINNAEFICSDAIEAAEHLAKNDELPDVVIVDPPRKGCAIEVIDIILKMKPQRLVYVSCDPATLARDLKVFVEKGYIIKEITPVDMFPRTSHVESVCLLMRKS